MTLRIVGVLKAPFRVSASGSFFPAFSAASPRILPRPRSGIGLSKPMPMLWKSVSVNSGGRWQSVQLALSELLKTSKPLTTSSFTADLSPAWYLSHGESCDRIVRRNVARACAIFPAVAGPLKAFWKSAL